MRVLVTRPAAQAREWVVRLTGQGFEAVALPLIAIGGPPEPAAVVQAWHALAARDLVVFVSPSAAAQFFAWRPQGLAWPGRTCAGAPGPGTGAALRGLGVAPELIVEPDTGAGRFDSEALWAALEPKRAWQGASVLIVRGAIGPDDAGEGSGREWLAQTLLGAGATVAFVVAYRRGAPRWRDDEQALWQAALATPAEQVWLLSSSEAVDHLVALAASWGGQVPWNAWRALATHPRIAHRARAAGFGVVLQSAPTLAAVTAALQSCRTSSIESGAP